MFICKNCKEKFQYKSVFKNQKNFKFKCNNCNSKYKLNNLYQWIDSILVALPCFFVKQLVNFLGIYVLLFYGLWLLIIFLIMPLFYKFDLDSEERN